MTHKHSNKKQLDCRVVDTLAHIPNLVNMDDDCMGDMLLLDRTARDCLNSIINVLSQLSGASQTDFAKLYYYAPEMFTALSQIINPDEYISLDDIKKLLYHIIKERTDL